MRIAVKKNQPFDDTAPLSAENLALVQHLASETVYFISHVQSLVEICALALEHQSSHEGRVAGQVQGVLDLLSEILEAKLDGDLTKLEISAGKVGRAIADAGNLADLEIIETDHRKIIKRRGDD